MTSRVKLHPATRALTGSLYGRLVHPRRIPLTEDGVALVAETHRKQLSVIGVDLDALRGFSVLECGGTGRDALAWAHLGAGRVTHVDLSEENPRRVRDYCEAHGIESVTSVQGDLLAVDLPSQGFDIVRSRGVLHHLGDPALGLARYARWTRLGGWLHFNAYRGGTFYYYGVKLIRSLVREADLEAVLAAVGRLGLSPADAGILLDDFFVPCMHTADPRKLDRDLERAGLVRLWPRRSWARVDHDVLYPDMPQKDEHLQYWLRKDAHFEDAGALAARLQYHEGEDDVALGRSQPRSGESLAAFEELRRALLAAPPARRTEALVRIYREHHYAISTVEMSGRERHERLAACFRREVSGAR